MLTEDEINLLIDDSTQSLINDSPERAAKSLELLAFECGRAGSDGLKLFQHLRTLAITGAIAVTDKPYIIERLQLAENIMRKKRNDRKENEKTRRKQSSATKIDAKQSRIN